ncbi:MAG: hypothetical protein ABFS37_08250 [Acidobacteriota bacterium]
MKKISFGRIVALAVFVIAVAWNWTAVAAPESSPGGQGAPDASEAEAKEEAPKNTLKWTTASEVENFGFDIFRGESEDGPFEKRTDDPLPGAGTTDEPQSYLWEDFDIKKGQDYYYYIESISMAGVRERFSPIIKSPAK